MSSAYQLRMLSIRMADTELLFLHQSRATEEAYALRLTPLIAVLDAQRALVDARVSALEAQAARANAWTDLEHALGAP